MPVKLSEGATVQEPLLRYAEEAGWTRINPYDAAAMRCGEGGLLLREVFCQALQRLNPGAIDLHRAEDIARRISQVPPSIEGNFQVWEYLRGLRTVYVPEERRERDLRLLDTVNVDANSFHVTEELSYDNGTHRIRPDVVFFVNGLPVLVVEAKAAQKEEGIAEALKQLCRYHREGPELMALLQVQVLTNLLQFRYGATWVLSGKYLFDWRGEQVGDFETIVKHFVSPSRVLRMLTEFILFTRKDDVLSKVILRPHQMRAVERVLGRCRDGSKTRGLVWHTQGSGKTYTMMTVAKRLIEDAHFQNPTVLMLVDRNELEAQLFGNLESAGVSSVAVAESKRHLRTMLREDRRGLIVSMIHKFDDIPADLNLRSNIYVLVDEAHRTTGGDLGNYLMGALPNATYIGFTGTPIDRTTYGQGTFKVFGRDDERGYIDKYSIAESIGDGTTVPLHYALAPSTLRVDRETLNREFLDLAEAEGVSDPEKLNAILDRAVTLKNMLKNRQRVRQVAEHLAEHYRQYVEPMGYKAFLVAVDREACALYKEALDEHLPASWSTVVYSAAHNDPPELTRWHLSADAEKEVRKRFTRPDEEPRILIVTDKLLTGFDAPILYCMYLDKPMRDHVLLQAIARVNRPYEDDQNRRKTNGLIYDFVGVFENLEKALAFDSQDVEGVVEGLDVLKARFDTLMDDGRKTYLTLWAGLHGDKAAEEVLEHFRDESCRHDLYGFYTELQDLYEVLSPDPFLRPYLDDYLALSEMHRLVRAAYERHVSVDGALLRKTARLVQESTSSSPIIDPDRLYRLDGAVLHELANDDKPDAVKVFNLVKTVETLVAQQAAEAPHLIPIGERAAHIIEQYEQRLLSARQALEAMRQLVADYELAMAQREASNLSKEGFGVYWLLRNDGIPDAEDLARAIEPAFASYPHWMQSQRQERGLRIAFYKAMGGRGEVDTMVGLVDRVLDVLRRATT
jgi:type I restriction enzyme R subunit